MSNAIRATFTGLFAGLAMICAISPLHAGDKKGKNLAVSFHIETDGNSNPKMIFQQQIGGKLRYFSKMPEFSTKDIVAFSPFLGDDGFTYGAAFKLRSSATTRLENTTTANLGRYLCAAVNGRAVDAVIIDQPVKDGFLIVWQGIQEAEVKEYDKLVPRVGKEKK